MLQRDPQGPAGPTSAACSAPASPSCLGVAFLSGTLVLGDTMRADFDDLFADANAGTDAVVRSAADHRGRRRPRPDAAAARSPASLVDRLRGVDGVAAAEPSIDGLRPAHRHRRRADRRQRARRRLAGNWIDDPDAQPLPAWPRAGRPQAPDEVVIDRGAADDGELAVGDTTTVQTPEPVRGDHRRHRHLRRPATASAGATFTAFTLAGAERLPDRAAGPAASVHRGPRRARRQPATALARPRSPAACRRRSRRSPAPSSPPRSTDEHRRRLPRLLHDVPAGVRRRRPAGGHASASTTRSRSSSPSAAGSRRCCGRSARPGARSLDSVVVEAAAHRAWWPRPSAWLAGVGIAGLGLKALFDGFGLRAARRRAGLRAGTAVAVAWLVGIVVTLVAGVCPGGQGLPGRRPSPPCATTAVDRTGASRVAGRRRRRCVTAVGVAVVLLRRHGDGDGALALAGLGAVADHRRRGGARARRGPAGQPASSAGRCARLRGVHRRRWPGRTPCATPGAPSGTAAALMVGVGVVTLFTVFAASLKASVDDTRRRVLRRRPGRQRRRASAAAACAPAWPGHLAELPEVAARRRPRAAAPPWSTARAGDVTVADVASLAHGARPRRARRARWPSVGADAAGRVRPTPPRTTAGRSARGARHASPTAPPPTSPSAPIYDRRRPHRRPTIVTGPAWAPHAAPGRRQPRAGRARPTASA